MEGKKKEKSALLEGEEEQRQCVLRREGGRICEVEKRRKQITHTINAVGVEMD